MTQLINDNDDLQKDPLFKALMGSPVETAYAVATGGIPPELKLAKEQQVAPDTKDVPTDAFQVTVAPIKPAELEIN